MPPDRIWYRGIIDGVAGLRRFFDGTGPWSGLGGGALLLGFAMLLAVLLSPHGWQWWLDAHQVHGRELDGVVSYSFQGQEWSVDDSSSATRTGPRTVYVIAAAPGDGALTNTPNVILDWIAVGGPTVLGGALLSLGFIRRSRLRQRRVEVERSGSNPHGYAIPSNVIKEIVAERAQNTPRPGGQGR